MPPTVDPSGTLMFHRQPLPWEAAEAQCISVGGHLLSVGTAGENLFAVEYALQQFVEVAQPRIWLGGTDFAVEVRCRCVICDCNLLPLICLLTSNFAWCTLPSAFLLYIL